MEANNENYRIRVAALPVTAPGSSSNSELLVIEAEIKVNLHRARPINLPSSINSSTASNKNNHLLAMNKFQASKYRGGYTLSWSELTSDTGGPTSQSWALISDMISRISASIPFSLDDQLHWQGTEMDPTPLEGRDQLVKRVLDVARSMAGGRQAADETQGQGVKGFNSYLKLSITKEVFLAHDRFVACIHEIEQWIRIQEILDGCVSRLEPPLELEKVRREIMASFRAGGRVLNLNLHIPDDEHMLSILTERVLIRVKLRKSVEQSTVERMGLASKKAINELDNFELIGDDSEEQQCAVCNRRIVNGGMVTKFPCSHRYHSDCAKEWLRRSHMCPLCSFELPTQ